MNVIEAGLYTKLGADTALISELGGETAVYNRHAPQGVSRPYVVFFHAGGGHENLNPSDLQNHVYLVKGVSDGSKEAGTIDGLCKAALHKQTITVSGYTNFYTARENEVQTTEITREGVAVYHTGAYYRIRIDD